MKSVILYPINVIILFFEKLGDYFNLISKIFRSHKTLKYYLPLTIHHMFQTGVKSIPIVIITGLFAGMVLAVQAAYQLESSTIPGGDAAVGSVVGEAILLELAPIGVQ